MKLGGGIISSERWVDWCAEGVYNLVLSIFSSILMIEYIFEKRKRQLKLLHKLLAIDVCSN